jgi:hypothetical protein
MAEVVVQQVSSLDVLCVQTRRLCAHATFFMLGIRP